MGKLSKETMKLKKSILKEYDISDEAGQAILQTGMEAYDLMHRAQAAVDVDGLTVPGDRGNVKAHPLLSVIRDARAQFLMALKHLNLDIEPLRDKPGRPGGR
jgi:P27 family predicted phage terminase small subunit